MSNDKHTPTPWEARGNYLFNKESKRSIGSLHRMNFNLSMAGTYMPCKESEANAARIVQCVNEYDGLIETISTLRAEKAELIEALGLMAQRTLAKIETK
jgi:hypothetical protein